MGYYMQSTLAGLVAVVAMFVGCQSETTAPIPEDSGADAQSAANAALESLSQEDQELAAAQKFVCPVSDGPLGDMGSPVKVTLGDKSLLLCCAGCEEEATADFDKYYAKAHGDATPDQ